MRLSDAQLKQLSDQLGRVAARAAPSWTGSSSHDPGVTLVSLFAFLAEQLQYRRNQLSASALSQWRKAALQAAAISAPEGAASDVAGDSAGLRRVRYFAGQLLGAADFEAEQHYVVERLNRRNRLLHGGGIAAGLEVTIDAKASPAAVLIGPGLAFDRLGREIHVDAPCGLALPPAGTELWVRLSYREDPCQEVPAAADAAQGPAAGGPLAQATRILETFDAALDSTPDGDGITIARAHRQRGRWRVDAAFKPARIRR